MKICTIVTHVVHAGVDSAMTFRGSGVDNTVVFLKLDNSNLLKKFR